MEDIPCKIPYVREGDDKQVEANIKLYIASTLKLLGKYNSNNSLDSELGSIVEYCENFLSHGYEENDPKVKFKILRNRCDPYLHALFKPIVLDICDEMSSKSDQYADDLLNMKYNLRFSKYSHDNVSLYYRGDLVYISNGQYQIKLNVDVFKKLQMLYEISNVKHRDKMNFYIWALVRRYTTLLGGLRRYEGSGLQAAVPRSAFDTMSKLFGVSMECFASPFNCYYENFCSVFNDIDLLFNSSGSFFHFYPDEGSFEANPPFCEEVIDKMSKHMEYLLETSEKPLSFIIYVPNWINPPCLPIEYMKQSKYNRESIIVEPENHLYMSGFQADGQKAHIFQPVHSTLVLFLQNEEGNIKWKPTIEKIAELKVSLRERMEID